MNCLSLHSGDIAQDHRWQWTYLWKTNTGQKTYLSLGQKYGPHTARLWSSLLLECFPLTYNLSGFKSRMNRHLLNVGSF